MILKKLTLTNFRNYETFTLNPPAGVTIIVAQNGTGKSNILESIFLLATTKSERVERENEVIQFGKELARLEAIAENKEGEVSLELIITKGMVNGDKVGFKKAKVNGVNKRTTDFVGNITAVQFAPQDVELITNTPSKRRKHMDFFISQMSSTYRITLSQYTKVITQRNKLLERIREGQAHKDELEFWNTELLTNGKILSDARSVFFKKVNEYKDMYPQYHYIYHPSEISKEKIEESEKRDIAAAQTLHGPHRDDFLFFERERDLSLFGSRGEQRTAVFALKTAELHYMTDIKSERPILLLDDIFSELDETHREEVLRNATGGQTIITTTDELLIPENLRNSSEILNLSSLKGS